MAELNLWTDLSASNGIPTGTHETQTGAVELPATGLDHAEVIVYNPSGSLPTLEARMWAYSAGPVAAWFPLGPDPAAAGDSTKAGWLNDGNTITALSGTGDGSGSLRHSQPLQFLSSWDALYLEAISLSGSDGISYNAYIRYKKLEKWKEDI